MFKAKKKARVFGVPLAESTHLNRSSDSPVVASVVTDVMSYLEKHGSVGHSVARKPFAQLFSSTRLAHGVIRLPHL